MLHEEKKAAKIVEELTIFFFGIGGNEMSSSMKRDKNKVYIRFTSNYHHAFAHKIEVMEDYLNRPKNDGVEDIYWELAGSGDPGEASQLLLIGMMIDKAVIHKEEGSVTVEIEKIMG